jgi:hypothetical protein
MSDGLISLSLDGRKPHTRDPFQIPRESVPKTVLPASDVSYSRE